MKGEVEVQPHLQAHEGSGKLSCVGEVGSEG